MRLRDVADVATALVAGAALLLVTYHISGRDTSEAAPPPITTPTTPTTTAPPTTTTATTPTTTTAPWDTTPFTPLDGALNAGRELVAGVDVSVYAGSISPEQWATAAAAGVKVAVIGAWHGKHPNPNCEQWMADAVAAGLAVAVYVAINALPGAEAVAKGAAACGDEWQHANFVALDVEITGVDQQIIDSAIDAVTTDGLRPVLYTGRWFWQEHAHLGDPNWASARGVPLWHAAYDGDRSLTFGRSGPYGGWTAESLIGHQYAGTNTEDGFSDDRNVFDRAFIAAG